MGGCRREPAPIAHRQPSAASASRMAWWTTARLAPRPGLKSVPRERHSNVAGETIFAPARSHRETKQRYVGTLKHGGRQWPHAKI